MIISLDPSLFKGAVAEAREKRWLFRVTEEKMLEEGSNLGLEIYE